MTEPKVELKSVHFGYSREWGTNGRFDADIWINGIKCMKAIDEGNGGCIDYEYFTYNNPKLKEVEANIKLLEDYIKTLPPDVSEISGKPFSMPIDMDLYLEKKLNEFEAEKFEKKRVKYFEVAIVYGVPKSKQFGRVFWTGKKLSEINLITLQKTYNDLKNKLKTGEVIQNTNLQTLGINL